MLNEQRVPVKRKKIEMRGSELRKIRLGIGLTQKEFGHAVGYHYISINNFENNKRPIPKRLAVTARALQREHNGNERR